MGRAPADAEERVLVGEWLRRDPVVHAWPIQDLRRWPDRTRLFVERQPSAGDFGFLLVSGHPGTGEVPVVILGGDPTAVGGLLQECLPPPPLVIRETSALHLPQVLRSAPDAMVYLEQRMEVSRSEFKSAHRGIARKLETKDAVALARFFGAPPQAASGFEQWLMGGLVYGVFEGDRLASIASAMVRIPEAWVLVSIETVEALRGRGLATEVTSAITARALEEAPVVSLTVRKDNAAAIRLYTNLGYLSREDRIWVSVGTDATP